MMRLLRPPHSGIFLRSFRLHGAHHARETIAKICSLWVALATAIRRPPLAVVGQTGSYAAVRKRPAKLLDGHRLREVPRLIDIAAFLQRYVVCQQL